MQIAFLFFALLGAAGAEQQGEGPLGIAPQPSAARTLEEVLQAEDPGALAEEARRLGDAARGAVLFHQPLMNCAKCHAAGEEARQEADRGSSGAIGVAPLRGNPQGIRDGD